MCLYRLQYGETKVHFCSWCWQCLSRPHPPPPLSTPSASALTGSLCQHLSPDNQWLLDYIWRPTALAWSQVWFPRWQSASHLMAEKQELSLTHTHTLLYTSRIMTSYKQKHLGTIMHTSVHKHSPHLLTHIQPHWWLVINTSLRNNSGFFCDCTMTIFVDPITSRRC